MNRRNFLKFGVVGSALLAAGGAWVVWRDVKNADDGIAARDRVGLIVSAIAPALLAGALPADRARREEGFAHIATGVKAVIATFPIAVQAELADLFRLLDIRFARKLLAGLSSDWADAQPSEVAGFLERWRTSRFRLLQVGYFALHDLILGTWYADPATWESIGYPGPPNVE
jgi:hypothetical protein